MGEANGKSSTLTVKKHRLHSQIVWVACGITDLLDPWDHVIRTKCTRSRQENDRNPPTKKRADSH